MVAVFDDVFDQQTANEILSLEKKFKSEGFMKVHCYFDRRITPYRLSVEYLLDEICQRCGDESPIIEYWIRTKWMNMECHQDVNEHLNRKNGELVMPNYGHVLYLSDSEGPTMVYSEDFTKVTCVPPKLGRMTRFTGNLFHAVPYPWNFILTGESSTEKQNRPVLLFNTWSTYEHYPTFELMKVSFEDILSCQNLWKSISIPEISIQRPLIIYVQFMGNSTRRRGKHKSELYYGPEEIANQKIVGCYGLEKIG